VGHAVIGWVLGLKFGGVSINPDDGGGRVKISIKKGTEDEIVCILAGPYAQRRFAPGSRWRARNRLGDAESSGDFDIVEHLIHRRHGEGKLAKAYWRYVEARAEALVAECWVDIEALARALLERGKVTREEVHVLLKQRFERALAAVTKRPDARLARGKAVKLPAGTGADGLRRRS
jgi:hypothetical protein